MAGGETNSAKRSGNAGKAHSPAAKFIETKAERILARRDERTYRPRSGVSARFYCVILSPEK